MNNNLEPGVSGFRFSDLHDDQGLKRRAARDAQVARFKKEFVAKRVGRAGDGCFKQDQHLDEVDFTNLCPRLRQNTVLERLTNLRLTGRLAKEQVAAV